MAAAPDDRVPADAVQFDRGQEEHPAALYDGDGEIPLYDENAGEPGVGAYQQLVEDYAGAETGGTYDTGTVTAASPSPEYIDTIETHQNTALDEEDVMEYVLNAVYDTDAFDPVDPETELLDEYREMMEQYDLDPEDGWRPADDSYGLDTVAALLDGAVEEMNGIESVDETAYTTTADTPLEEPDVYGRYLTDEDDDASYVEIAVVEQEMPDGLFGFTRPERENVVFVNKALYKVDKENTKLHEITHQEHPHWSEFMVRSRRTRGGGDLDPRYTMSFQANNPGRMGTGSGRLRPYNAANHTAEQYA